MRARLTCGAGLLEVRGEIFDAVDQGSGAGELDTACPHPFFKPGQSPVNRAAVCRAALRPHARVHNSTMSASPKSAWTTAISPSMIELVGLDV